MKKLRLVKPWDLEPVYMQTLAGRPDLSAFSPVFVTCNGPQAPETEEETDGRFGPAYTPCRYANAAPVSGAIFAAETNYRMG